VPEEFLNTPQIRTIIQQMGRKGVAQRVRREVLVDAALLRVALDDVPEGLARHAVAAARREQVVRLAVEQDLAARAAHEIRQPAHGDGYEHRGTANQRRGAGAPGGRLDATALGHEALKDFDRDPVFADDPLGFRSQGVVVGDRAHELTAATGMPSTGQGAIS